MFLRQQRTANEHDMTFSGHLLAIFKFDDLENIDQRINKLKQRYFVEVAGESIVCQKVRSRQTINSQQQPIMLTPK